MNPEDTPGALPENVDEVTTETETESNLILPWNRRAFLGAMAIAGAGLALPPGVEAQEKQKLKDLGPKPKPKTDSPLPVKKQVKTEVKKAANSISKPAKPVEEVRVAIIGPGSQGRNLLLNALKVPGVRFVAVCDIWKYSQTYAANLCAAKPFNQKVNVYSDYQEMLDKQKDIDAVIIATPDWMHSEHTVACLKAGKHVYCEKEMSNTLEGAQAMIKTQRETGKLLQIGHQRRSNPRYWHALELIHKENILGRMTHFYGQWNRPKRLDLGWPKNYVMSDADLQKYGYDTMDRFRNWRWYKKFSGGPMADLGSHQLDVFIWFLRTTPSAVLAAGGLDYYKDREWNDNVAAIYEFETERGKARGFYEVYNSTGYGGFYEAFMGDEGALEISEDEKRGFYVREPDAKPKVWEDDAAKVKSMGQDAIKLVVGETLNPTGRPKEQKLAAASTKPPHYLHLENFFNAIRGDGQLTCPPEVGYETTVAVFKANDAVIAGKRLEFDKDEFKV